MSTTPNGLSNERRALATCSRVFQIRRYSPLCPTISRAPDKIIQAENLKDSGNLFAGYSTRLELSCGLSLHRLTLVREFWLALLAGLAHVRNEFFASDAQRRNGDLCVFDGLLGQMHGQLVIWAGNCANTMGPGHQAAFVERYVSTDASGLEALPSMFSLQRFSATCSNHWMPVKNRTSGA